MGIVMGVNSVLSGIAPLIAAVVVNSYGIGSVFTYAAVLWVAGAVVLAFTPLRPPPGVPRRIATGRFIGSSFVAGWPGYRRTAFWQAQGERGNSPLIRNSRIGSMRARIEQARPI